MNGAELICKVLEKKGVKHIFGLFGDIQTEFAHAVRKSKIKWIGVYNEKSGGFMADIYARISGMPGVVFSTLGPGGTNLTSALANATLDRSPLIAISDQVLTNDLRLNAHQFIDFTKSFHPSSGITKYAVLIKDIKQIPYIFEEAFSIAMKEPKGAVHISIAADIFGEKIKKKKIKVYKEQKNKKQTIKINALLYKHVLKILRTGMPGLVIAGGSIERSSAQNSFRDFIEKYKLPVLTTFRGKNALSSDHPQCLGTISRHLTDVIREIINDVSYVLTVGYDYNEGVKPILWKSKEQNVINIDSYDNRISNVFSPPTLIGDINEILKKLFNEKIDEYSQDFDFHSMKKKVHETVIRQLDVKNKKLHPKHIIDAVNKLYSKNSIIICDVGLNKYYSGLLLKSTDTNRILFSNGMSSMAFSSGALGAKIANPNKDVVVLVGDGGFLMNFQEVLTARQNEQQIIYIIFNNGGLGLIEQAQMKQELKHHGVKFGKIGFTHLASGFGLTGVHIKKGSDLLPILTKLKKSRRSAIIDVAVEYTSGRQ